MSIEGYELPGQQLATVIGLFVWNFLICRGMDLAQPPLELPAQSDAKTPLVAEPPLLPRQESAEGGAQPTKDDNPSSTEKRPNSITEERPATGSGPEDVTTAHIIDALDEIDWDHALRKHDAWDWLAHEAGLRCPAGNLLPFAKVEQVKGIPVRMRFTAPAGTCDACDLRSACIRSKNRNYRKEVRLPIPSPHAEPLLAMWRKVEAQPKSRKPMVKSKARLKARSKARHSIWRLKPLSWRPPDLPPERPAFAVAAPMLLPAKLRKISRRVLRLTEVHVSVELPRDKPKLSEVLAFSPAQRQNRRLSWDERLRWNELPDGAEVEVRFLGDGIGSLITPTVGDARGSTKSAST